MLQGWKRTGRATIQADQIGFAPAALAGLAAAGTSQGFVAESHSVCVFQVHLQSLSAAEIFFHLSSLIQAQLLIRQ